MRLALLGWVWLAGFPVSALGHGEQTPVSLPHLYEAPKPGSYELPVILEVHEHQLLSPSGTPAALLDLAPDQVALVAFIYTSCTEATGCPLALASLQKVDRMLAERPDLAGRTRLVTTSFDPARDTPLKMKRLRESLAPRSDWRFRTVGEVADIIPVLQDFRQDLAPVFGADGAPDGRLSHVLKVFLVDGRLAVRNIYSSGFLDPRLLVADVETVLTEH